MVGQIIGVQRFENQIAHSFQIYIHIAQYPGCFAFAVPQQCQQQMFGADKIIIHLPGFFSRQQNDAFHAAGQRQIAHFLNTASRAGATFLHLQTQFFNADL